MNEAAGARWTGALLLGLLVILAVAAGFLVDARAERGEALGERSVELGEPVIPRAREPATEELLAPLEHAFAALEVEAHSFAIEGRVIEVQLFTADTPRAGDDRPRVSCPGPSWVRAPGALILEHAAAPTQLEDGGEGEGSVVEGALRVSWYACAAEDAPRFEAAALALARRANEAGAVEQVWTRAELSPELSPGRDDHPGGILSPVVVATGLDHELLTLLVLGLGLAAAIAVGLGFADCLPGPAGVREPPRRFAARVGWLVLVLVLLIRLYLAARLGPDVDEIWARVLERSIFHDGQDSRLHPPLFHALAQPWARLGARFELDRDLVWLRTPALILGVLATGLVIAQVATRLRSPAMLALLLPCSLGVGLNTDLVLARPYAAGAFLVASVAFLLWAPWPAESRRLAGARWTAILLAVGLSVWTDVLAGVAASALVTLRVLAPSPIPRAKPPSPAPARAQDLAAKLAVLAVLALWIAPLIFGALEAARIETAPEAEGGHLLPGPRATEALAAYLVFGSERGGLGLAILAGALALALAAWGWRNTRWGIEAWIPALTIFGALAFSATLMHLRTRNLAFAPLLFAQLAAVVLSQRLERPRAP